jgi:transposase-like protein
MAHEGRSPLAGRIEADKVILEGAIRSRTGRGVIRAQRRTLVFGAVEVVAYQDKHDGNLEKAGCLRLAVAPRADTASIRSFLTSNVLPGSVINTDGSKGYSGTALAGYRHELRDPETHALHIHRAFGNLKTWLNGTHHGVDPKYLKHYLDEFVFRFNRSNTPMDAFRTLLGLATQRNHVPLKRIVNPESKG